MGLAAPRPNTRVPDANSRDLCRASHTVREERHRREAPEGCGRIDDRAQFDRYFFERIGQEIRHQRRAGEISFRQQGRIASRATRARLAIGDREPRLPDAPADLAEREAQVAYRRYHQGVSPLSLSQPPDPPPAL